MRLGAVAKDFEKVRPIANCNCLWSLKENSELSSICMCSACTVKCPSVPWPYFAIGSAKEGILSACCSTTSSLTSSTQPPSYWSLPIYRSACVAVGVGWGGTPTPTLFFTEAPPVATLKALCHSQMVHPLQTHLVFVSQRRLHTEEAAR